MVPDSHQTIGGFTHVGNFLLVIFDQVNQRILVFYPSVLLDGGKGIAVEFVFFGNFYSQVKTVFNKSVYLSDFPLAFSMGYLYAFVLIFSATISKGSNWCFSASKNA